MPPEIQFWWGSCVTCRPRLTQNMRLYTVQKRKHESLTVCSEHLRRHLYISSKYCEPDCSGFLLKYYTSLINVKEKLFWELNKVERSFLPKSENDLLLSLSRKEDKRSSHQRFSVKKGVLRNFAKFTGKHLRHLE